MPSSAAPLSMPSTACLPPVAPAARSNGLDTLRAAAIVLVFAYHYRVFVAPAPALGWLATVGWTGVDLFFVLSGYLIAKGLFADFGAGGAVSARSVLPAFYARRALRTLPLFWLVLAAYLASPLPFVGALGGRPPPPAWRFLSCTQNLGLQPGTAFSHAWSLCIEEQFYLVLPLVLLAGRRLGLGRRAGWAALALLIVFGMATRALLWTRYGLESTGQLERYYPAVYYATGCRFDEFLPGIAVALLQRFHPAVWVVLMRRGRALLLAGALATGAVLYGVARHYYTDGVGYGFFMSVFGYSAVAMAFALLVLAALSPGCVLARWRVPGAAALARWSYAIYLSHKAVAFVLNGWLAPLALPAAVVFVLVTAACLAVGWALHRAVEAPFMALRERWWPVPRGRGGVPQEPPFSSPAAPPPARAAARA